MTSRPIRVLIVDDSATLRSALRIMIRKQPDMEVAGTAANGEESVMMVARHKPDIVIMDIEMPVMNGIEATEAIMDTNPVPILIFSSVAAESAPKTLDALDAGAIDFITKDGSENALNVGKLQERLLTRIRELAAPRMGGHAGRSPSDTVIRNRERQSEYRDRKTGIIPLRDDPLEPKKIRPWEARGGALTQRIVKRAGAKLPVRVLALGASTGGPQALHTVLAALPRSFPVPVTVVQHMPASFMEPFAKRLAAVTALNVKEAHQGEALKRGTVYLAPGGVHLRVVQRAGMLAADIDAGDVPGVVNRPSLDVLLQSLAESVRGECMAAVLTGMGRDGAAGAKALRALGAFIIAQDEASSVVYGMPRAVIEEGTADMVLPLEEIGDSIVDCVNRAPPHGMHG